MPLKNIPTNISPDLLQILAAMGHGDEIVIADGNFPAATCAKRLVYASGQSATQVLDSVLKLFPLDHKFVQDYAVVMQPVTPQDPPPIWKSFEDAIKKEENLPGAKLTRISREDFYERSKKAYAVVSTSDTALYANIILKKGVIA